MTMREGLIRVLERDIDTKVLKSEENHAAASSLKQDEGEASLNVDCQF